jgi:hypothetical protein
LAALGTVFEDPKVQEAQRERKPFILFCPNADASRGVTHIARHLLNKKGQDLAVSAFLDRFLDQLRQPFQISGLPPNPPLQPALGKHECQWDLLGDLSGDLSGDLPEDGCHDPSMMDACRVSEGSDENPDNTNVHETLCCLLDNVSAIMQDLKEIKSCVNRMVKKAPDTRTISEKPQSRRTDAIPLDFEAFLKNTENE